MEKLFPKWSGDIYSKGYSTHNKSLPNVWVQKFRWLPRSLANNGHFAAGMCERAVSKNYLLNSRFACNHYYESTHLFGDAFLKVCEGKMELPTDRGQLESAEILIRVGVSPVFSKCLATMNNKFLEEIAETKSRTYDLLVDANDQYDGFMEYPNYGPEYQLGQLGQTGIRRVTIPKLVQTLFAQEIYTVHYIILKLHEDRGLQDTTLHRIPQFKSVGALRQLEHKKANSVQEQVRIVFLQADEQYL